MPEHQQLLTVPQAIDITQLSRATMYRLIKKRSARRRKNRPHGSSHQIEHRRPHPTALRPRVECVVTRHDEGRVPFGRRGPRKVVNPRREDSDTRSLAPAGCARSIR